MDIKDLKSKIDQTSGLAEKLTGKSVDSIVQILNESGIAVKKEDLEKQAALSGKNAAKANNSWFIGQWFTITG